jgi:phosphoribosylaminoimidazole-succinocarboxamide synthase
VAAGNICKRINIAEGTVLPKTVIEFYYKDSQSNDSLVSEEHIVTLGILHREDIDIIKIMALRANDFLQGIFTAVNIRLVDFKIEFGKLVSEDYDTILIADEISPDTCRLWDYTTNEKLGYERFCLSLGNVENSYKEIAKRLKLLANDVNELEEPL